MVVHPLRTQCASGCDDGSLRNMTKFVAWPVVESTPGARPPSFENDVDVIELEERVELLQQRLRAAKEVLKRKADERAQKQAEVEVLDLEVEAIEEEVAAKEADLEKEGKRRRRKAALDAANAKVNRLRAERRA